MWHIQEMGSSELPEWREEVTKTDETRRAVGGQVIQGHCTYPIVSRGCGATRLGGGSYRCF